MHNWLKIKDVWVHAKQYFISADNDDLIFLCIHVNYMKALVGFDR